MQPAYAAAPTVCARAADERIAAVVLVAREAAAKPTASRACSSRDQNKNEHKRGANAFKLPCLSTGGALVSFARRHFSLQVAASHAMLSTQHAVQAADSPTSESMQATPALYLPLHVMKRA